MHASRTPRNPAAVETTCRQLGGVATRAGLPLPVVSTSSSSWVARRGPVASHAHVRGRGRNVDVVSSAVGGAKGKGALLYHILYQVVCSSCLCFTCVPVCVTPTRKAPVPHAVIRHASIDRKHVFHLPSIIVMVSRLDADCLRHERHD